MKYVTPFFICVLLLLASGLPLALPANDLPTSGKVIHVIDGDTVHLESGEKVRLLGIQAPETGRDAMPAQPYAKAAQRALAMLVEGKTVTLRYGSRPTDRYKRLLAQLYLPDKRWVQEELLNSGMAMVYSFPDNRAYVPQLLRAEKTARAAKAGLWSHGWYQPVPHERAQERMNRFALVYGTVKQVSDTKNGIYLNFDKDWSTDFTLFIPHKARARFDITRLQPLKGQHIMVRGWVHYKNGPGITLTHPEQIEELAND